MSAAELAPDGEVTYGLLTLAGIDVALPLSALREVVSCPQELSGLPAAATGLLGAMNLRSLVLPVVDIAPGLGLPTERDAGQVVVVVAHGGQVLGVLADEVRGVTRVPTSELQTMTAGDTELLFSHTFRDASDRVVSVLDAGSLLAWPGVPTVADSTRGATGITSAGAAGKTAGSSRKLTVVRCGPHVLALEVAQVHTTLEPVSTRPSVLDGGLCRGVTSFADREVPVADPLQLLGLGSLRPDEGGSGLVLDLGNGYVVLAVSQLLDLLEVPDTDVLAVPSFAVPRADLVAGVARIPRGQCFVLDGEALLADHRLAALAAVNTSLHPTDDDLAGSGVDLEHFEAAPAYLTYSIGLDVVTPLDQVAEILPMPTEVIDTAVGAAVMGLMLHRSSAVPVLCTATLLGRPRPAITNTACVLVVEVDGDRIAFASSALHSIEPLTWTDPEGKVAQRPEHPTAFLRAAPLVRVGVAPRLLPEVDLHALARLVRGPLPLPRTAEDDLPAGPPVTVGSESSTSEATA